MSAFHLPQGLQQQLEGGICAPVNGTLRLERGMRVAEAILTPPTPGAGWRWEGAEECLSTNSGRQPTGTALLCFHSSTHAPQHQRVKLTPRPHGPACGVDLGPCPQPLLNPRPQVPQSQETPQRGANTCNLNEALLSFSPGSVPLMWPLWEGPRTTWKPCVLRRRILNLPLDPPRQLM